MKKSHLWIAAGAAALFGSLLLPAILYFSPARTAIYQALHGEYRAHREMLGEINDSLSRLEMRIRMADSVEAAELVRRQPDLWKKHTLIRRETLRLAQSQSSPSLPGLGAWLAVFWYLPLLTGMMLLPVCYVLLNKLDRAESRSRKEKPPSAAEPEPLQGDPSPGEPSRQEPLASGEASNTPNPAWEETRYMRLDFLEPSGTETEPVFPELALSMEDEEPHSDFLGKNDFDKAESRKREVLRLARKGLTPSEISRRLRMSQDQVEMLIRLKRDKG